MSGTGLPRSESAALRFEVRARCGSTRARLGVVTTRHGSFDTPAFMPVGTQGTVKGLLPQVVAGTGAQIVLGNTYHLLLRPGPRLVESLGGLHAFMNWPGPILTDSGGYQAYSMSDLTKLTDESVTFRSVVDGSMIELSPERAMEVQNALGADIIMALDDCPPSVDPTTVNQSRLRIEAARSKVSRSYDHAARLDEANERTIRWLERCARAHARPGEQSLFGIVQGGTDLDRRSRSAAQVTGVELPGYAIGGVAVGEGPEEIASVVRHTAPLLPEEKPRYLMGVGYERDLLAAVLAGVDMFDCVLPTRNGRNASAFTSRGMIRLRNAKYAEDQEPLEMGCDCEACRPRAWRGGDSREGGEGGTGAGGWFTRGSIRHLFLAEEMLGPMLVRLHNLRPFQRL
ncbi:MAG: tRNA guanosine(34) transglycosylase Tgt, partial [Planctomycetota bacterium]|nr:tRNA guanosine(34) transglycosylase Tgt [Planctomycetota bacterium]